MISKKSELLLIVALLMLNFLIYSVNSTTEIQQFNSLESCDECLLGSLTFMVNDYIISSSNKGLFIYKYFENSKSLLVKNLLPTTIYTSNSLTIYPNNNLLLGYPVDNSNNYIKNGVIYIVDMNNWNIINTLDAGIYATNNGNFGCSLKSSSSNLIVGSKGDNSSRGSIYIYYYFNNQWYLDLKITPKDLNVNDYFGANVDINNNDIIVSNLGNKSVYIYYKTSTWLLIKKINVNHQNIRVQNGYIFVSDYSYNSNRGVIYVYERNTGGISNWGEKYKITPNDNYIGQFFGYYFDIKDNYMSVNTLIGKEMYTFKFNGTNWEQLNKYTSVDAGFSSSIDNKGNFIWGINNDNTYGYKSGNIKFNNINDLGFNGTSAIYYSNSISLDNNRILLGSKEEYVDLFYRNNGVWELSKKFVSSNYSITFFGQSVVIKDNYVIISAPKENKVYLYEEINNNWNNIKQISPLDGVINDYFGYSISYDNNVIVVGSYRNSNPYSIGGSVYIFKKDQGGINNWGQFKKITPNNPSQNMYFGSLVYIKGDNLVVSTCCSGLKGIVYVYKNYIEQQIITNNTQQFGNSISIDNNYLIISSNTDKSVYIYQNNGSYWNVNKQLKIDSSSLGISFTLDSKYLNIISYGTNVQYIDIYYVNNKWDKYKTITNNYKCIQFGISSSYDEGLLLVNCLQKQYTVGSKAVYGGASYIYGISKCSIHVNSNSLFIEESIGSLQIPVYLNDSGCLNHLNDKFNLNVYSNKGNATSNDYNLLTSNVELSSINNYSVIVVDIINDAIEEGDMYFQVIISTDKDYFSNIVINVTIRYNDQQCNIGNYMNSNDQCQECSTGTYQNVKGQSFCASCQPGTFTNRTAMQQCNECSTGTYNIQNQQSTCLYCQPGTYNDQTKQTSCISCPIGYYQSKEGQSECFKCPAGSYSVVKGISLCLSCPKGQYQPEIGQSSCITCDITHYTSSENSANQIKCPDNSEVPLNLRPGTRLDHCQCLNGFYGIPGGECLACPKSPGATCPGGLQRYPLTNKGFWFNNNNWFQCPQTEACLAGKAVMFQITSNFTSLQSNIEYNNDNDKNVAEGQCNTGYDGRMCSLCSNGYYRLNGNCVKCPLTSEIRYNIVYQISIVFGENFFLIIFIAILFWIISFLVQLFDSSDSSPLGISVIIINFCQILNQTTTYDADWPIQITYIKSIFSIFNPSLNIVSKDCFTVVNYYLQWSSTLLLPIGVITVIGLISLSILVIQLLLKTRLRKLLNTKITNLKGSEVFLGHASLRAEGKYRQHWDVSLNAFFIFFIVSYVEISYQVIGFFSCTYQPDGTWSWNLYPSLYCFDFNWFILLPFVLLYLSGYIIGLPLITPWFIVYDKKINVQNSKSKRISGRWFAFIESYQDKYYLYEFIFLSRRLSYVCLFLLGNYLFSVTLILMVIVMMTSAYAYLHTRYYAYGSDYDNTAELASSIGIIIVNLCGIVYSTRSVSNRDYIIITIVLIITILVVFGIMLTCLILKIYSSIYSRIQMMKEKKKLNKVDDFDIFIINPLKECDK